LDEAFEILAELNLKDEAAKEEIKKLLEAFDDVDVKLSSDSKDSIA
jgi:hypothetical protein